MDQHPPAESKMGPQTRNNDEDLLRTSGSTMNDIGSSADAQFFRVLSDNMKYVFNSPIPTKTQFPTPYSSNQLDSSQQQDPAIGNNSMENGSVNTSFHRNPDSSFIDRTLNPQLYSHNNNTTNSTNNNGGNKNGIVTDALEDINIQPSSALQFSAVESTTTKQSKFITKSNNNNNENNTASNNNNNLTVPNNSNNNNTNIQTDFLLPSPVQLREFLYDSPAGINFFHNTPARSPLKFLNEDNNVNTTNNGPSSSNLMHLFNSVNNVNDPDNNNNNNGQDNINNLTDLWDRISTNTRTPLRKIDINLMFNNGQLLTNSNSMSPLKKLSMSLTPYGRRVLNDMGTPFNNNNNNNGMITSSGIKNTLMGSSNSALIDFQRARKDTTMGGPMLDNNNLKKSIVSMSPSASNNNTDTLDITSPKLVITPKKSKYGRKKKNLNNNQIPKLQKIDKISNNISIDSRIDNNNNNNNDDMDYDGSSPTTIQLNSSVTKSLPKMNMNTSNKLIDRIPVLSRNMTMMENNSLDVTLSPTPRSNINLSIPNNGSTHNNNNNNNNKLTFLPVPDLPKMGSFRSERTASTLTNSDISTVAQISNPASRLPSISTFPSTTILPPQTQPRKTIVKKKKVTKAKKPKFQIFVSSVHKFSDPNSSIPLSTLKNNSHSDNHGHKMTKRGKK